MDKKDLPHTIVVYNSTYMGAEFSIKDSIKLVEEFKEVLNSYGEINLVLINVNRNSGVRLFYQNMLGMHQNVP